MGKGARNRAKRKEAAEEQQSNGLTEALLEELFAVDDPSGFAELLARRPELWGGQVEDQLRELAAADGYARRSDTWPSCSRGPARTSTTLGRSTSAPGDMLTTSGDSSSAR